MTLNMFENVDKTNPPIEEELRAQRIHRRSYILILTIIVSNTLFFSLLT